MRCIGGSAGLIDAPAPSGEGVRVRVVSAGICGSDLNLLEWDLPFVMGHELAGTLDDGTPVAVEPIDACGICEPCREGAYNRCVARTGLVMGVGREGAMAEQCLVPATSIARLPAGVALRDACLVEPLAVAVHGVRQGGTGASPRRRHRRGRDRPDRARSPPRRSGRRSTSKPATTGNGRRRERSAPER